MVAKPVLTCAVLALALFSGLLWSRKHALEVRLEERQRATQEMANLRDDIMAYNKAAKVRAMEFVRGKVLVEVVR